MPGQESLEEDVHVGPTYVFRQGDQGVNPTITDAITQVNVKVIGEAAAVSLAQSYLAASQANSVLFANQVLNQQQLAMTSQSALAKALGLGFLDEGS